MRSFFKFSVISFSLIMSLISMGVCQASPIELQIDHVNDAGKIADTDHWDGKLVCEWQAEDLLVTFSHDVYPRALHLKIPALKSELQKNPKVEKSLDENVGKFILTTDSRLKFSMVGADASYPRQGSRCVVIAAPDSKSSVLSLSVQCTGLKDEARQFYSNLEIRSEAFSCPKP